MAAHPAVPVVSVRVSPRGRWTGWVATLTRLLRAERSSNTIQAVARTRGLA